MSLRFGKEGALLLIRTPSGKWDRHVEAFVQSKERWILKHYRSQQQHTSKRIAFHDRIQAGKIDILGIPHALQFLEGSKRKVYREQEELNIVLLPDDPIEYQMYYLYESLKLLAKSYLTERTLELAQATDSRVNTIRIKDLKSKWGSCSGKSNINLNWHLFLLDHLVVDYVIIHELMHLREMNHSKRFWSWVAHFYPNYKDAEKRLKSNSWLIGILTP